MPKKKRRGPRPGDKRLIRWLIEVCKGKLPDERIKQLRRYRDYDSALLAATFALLEKGVEDPSRFLEKKGLIKKVHRRTKREHQQD